MKLEVQNSALNIGDVVQFIKRSFTYIVEYNIFKNIENEQRNLLCTQKLDVYHVVNYFKELINIKISQNFYGFPYYVT